MDKKIILGKVISEKSFANANSGAGYTFYVDPTSEKIEIARAVESEFKVKVESVRTITIPGKSRINWKTRQTTRAMDKKKAFVVLKQGNSIKDFVKI